MGINNNLNNSMEKEAAEIKRTKELARKILPALEGLTRQEILNPVTLKVNLRKRFKKAKLDMKLCNIVYCLFRASVELGPKGSMVILDEKKLEYFINN